MKSIARTRFNEYADAVHAVHSIKDDIGLAVLCASQVISPVGVPIGPPLILETDYFSVIGSGPLSSVWFEIWPQATRGVGSFGVFSLPFARRTRPRYDNQIVERLIDVISHRTFPYVLIEPEYLEPKNRPHQYSELYPILLDSCLRLRVPMPRANVPTTVIQMAMNDAKSRLMDTTIRDIRSHPQSTTPSEYLTNSTFLRRLELSFLASGKLRDWTLLSTNLAKLDAALRWLFNDPSVDTKPYLDRAANDIVPAYVYRMLEFKSGFKTWQFTSGGGVHSPWRVEMGRLKTAGMLEFNKSQSVWTTTALGKEVLQYHHETTLNPVL